MPVDVFNRDGGVIDQNTHGQCQPAQGHDVQCFTQGVQTNDGAHDGQGDGNRNDKGGTPTAQKQKNHHTGQRGGNQALHGHPLNSGADKNRLVVDRLHDQVGR